MVTLAAFGDEIAEDLDEQLDVMRAEGVQHLELRKAWGKNVLDLTDAEIERVKAALASRGMAVSAIGSPIGKVPVTADFEEHLMRFDRALAVARFLETAYIRIFSFRIPPDTDPAQCRQDVMARLQALADRAQKAGVTLLHENEKRIYGDTDTRVADIFQTVASPALGCTFDPANFVQVGVRPFEEAYPRLRAHITYLHMKDAIFATRQVVAVGEGEGDVARLLGALLGSGYEGFLSLEPHLRKSPRYQALSAPDRFRAAASALKGLLRELGAHWQ